jgi:hypothetical protein
MFEDKRPLYNSWSGMIERCNNPSRSFYERYGGRGISVDKRWLSFENFLSDMENSWKRGLTLERIDNNGNYCKENCRWASREEQANNRSSNRIISYNGLDKTLSEWIKYFNLKSSTVRQRYYVYHWSVGKCFEN